MAAAIGAAPNAVYTYFPTCAALVEHLLATLEVEEHADWRDSLRAVALRLHGLLSRHPGVVPFFVAGPTFGPTALAAGEKVLRLSGEAGSRPTPPYGRSTLSWSIPSVSPPWTPPRFPQAREPRMADRVRQRRTAFKEVPAADHPRTRAAATTMAQFVTPAQFRSGLETLVTGLQRATPAV